MSSEAIHAVAANGKTSEANGKSAKAAASTGALNTKKNYKSLWGKVGKHGLMTAAAEKAKAADSSSSASSGSTSRNKRSTSNQPGSGGTGSGWDQLMPLLQKQRPPQSQQYYHHAQQVQSGAATAGSGWTDANMECDCGEDSCPRCNLMLQMGSDQW